MWEADRGTLLDLFLLRKNRFLIVQIMFIGMSFCLPIAYLEQRHLKNKKIRPDPAQDPLLAVVQYPKSLKNPAGLAHDMFIRPSKSQASPRDSVNSMLSIEGSHTNMCSCGDGGRSLNYVAEGGLI